MLKRGGTPDPNPNPNPNPNPIPIPNPNPIPHPNCPGKAGISFLLIERDETVETKAIKTSYTSAAGTSYVIFEKTIVPVANLLGQENNGFKLVMANFNHERCQSNPNLNPNLNPNPDSKSSQRVISNLNP